MMTTMPVIPMVPRMPAASYRAEPLVPAEAKAPGRDFSKVFTGEAGAVIEAALAEAIRLAQDFCSHYRGRVAGLSAAELAQAIEIEQGIGVIFDHANTPAALLNSADLENEAGVAAMAAIDDADAKVNEATAFFDAELSALGAERLFALANEADLKPWRQMFLDMAASCRHALSPETEELLSGVNATAAWTRAYKYEVGELRFDYRDEEIGDDALQPLLENKDPEIRADARAARIEAFAGNEDRFVAIYDEIVRISNFENRLRKYDRPEGDSLLDSGLEAAALDALVAAAEARIDISHRWTAAKLKALGTSLPARPSDLAGYVPGAEDLTYSWSEAIDIIAHAWELYCPTLSSRMKKLLTAGIIDAEARPGKEPGAYCWSDSRGSLPFVHTNWHGRPNDLIDLAHEMGHAIHADLIGATQQPFLQDPGRVMSETASTFSEGIVFDVMLTRAPSQEARRGLLAMMIDARIHTIFGQLAFHRFERRMHDLRKDGPLDAETLRTAFTEAETWYRGSAIEAGGDNDGGALWARVPHFFDSPFYVWTYAAADTISGALLSRRRHPDFERRYEALLRTGSARRPDAQLSEFGMDINSPDFWMTGFDELAVLIARFESLA